MNQITAMQMFVRVVETGSFTAVAEQMNTTQSTVSKRIAELEQFLGGKLLNRSTRSLRLTEAGSDYYERCISILQDIQQAEQVVRQAHTVPQGTVRINTVAAFGRLHVIPHLKALSEKYPQIDMELTLDDRTVDLVEKGVDVAFRMGNLSDSNLYAKKVCSSPFITVATPDYFAANGTPQHPSDLRTHNCITYFGIGNQHMLEYEVDGQAFNVSVAGTMATNNSEAMRSALIHGLGVTRVPHWLVGDLLDSGELREVLSDFNPAPLDIWAVYSSARYLPLKTRVVIDYFAEVFADNVQISGG